MQANDQETAMVPEEHALRELGSITQAGHGHTIHCLTVIGQIEGHRSLSGSDKSTKYEHVLPQLAEIEESEEIDGLLILLNTIGGDVDAGLAIAELIAGMRTPTVSLVLGGGHSIGVPLAVAARCSLIAPSAALTIHPVRMNGLVLGVPQTFAYFERIQERVVRFVTRNSRIADSKYRELMLRTDELATDVGTMISGEEAVELGLIDSLGTLSDALDRLHEMIDQNKQRPQANQKTCLQAPNRQKDSEITKASSDRDFAPNDA